MRADWNPAFCECFEHERILEALRPLVDPLSEELRTRGLIEYQARARARIERVNARCSQCQ